MSLQVVLEKMKKTRPLAEENVDEGPIETLGARRGRQKRAAEELKDLRREYSDSLLKSAVFILTVGSERDAFEKLIAGDGSGLLSQADEFFKDLSARIPETLYVGKGTVTNTFDVVGRHLEDKARELGMIEYPQLIYKQHYARTLKSPADLQDLLRLAVTEQVGGEVVGINAVRALTDKAIANNHSGTVTPILLSTEDQKYSVELIAHLERLTSRVFLVIAGTAPEQLTSTEGAIVVSEVSPKSAKAALKQIKATLKK